MKKAILFTAFILLTGSGIYLANNYFVNKDVKSIECPCTPDCQPGDAWCTCSKDSCEK